MRRLIKRLIPRKILARILPVYHFLLAYLGALYYRFPSRELTVVGITGTKGKSSSAEILGNIFDAAGYESAVLGTIKFKIGKNSERNLKKMTMPGRFFVQKFLRDAVTAGCTHAVVEMTSEGAIQYRERFIDMDALIFTNLSPEHIESHGSYEKYRDAKLRIARSLARSKKSHRYMVTNADDKESPLFLAIPHIEPIPFALRDAHELSASENGCSFSWSGTAISSTLGGEFNVRNILGVLTAASTLGVPLPAIAKGIGATTTIPGRMERVLGGQPFPVVVDYAHTPDSLEAIYKTFEDYDTVCILGNTGGGRDKWKRPVMGALADKYCGHIILSDEDPYDEDPKAILDEIAVGIKSHTPEVIIDRREAIACALARAKTNMQEKKKTAVLITGKGTDPFIMGPNGTKTPWDDRAVAKEEIAKINFSS
jgi:UDP-N-acetylmuramoyl-L-alanyl-D-glutamate--2,6-diaminopimelate ligase